MATLPGASLDNTLEGTSPGVAAGGDRTLANTESQLGTFKNLLRQTATLARAQNTPTVQQELDRYSSRGVNLVAPNLIGGALQAGTIGRRDVEQNVFSGVVDLIKQQETKLAEARQANLQFASQFMGTIASNPELLSVLDAKDFENLKSGVVSNELMQKIGQYAALETRRKSTAGGDIPISVAPQEKAPTFEEYVASQQKLNPKLFSVSAEQSRREMSELREQYDSKYSGSGAAPSVSLDQQLDFVTSGMSKDNRANAIKVFNRYVEAGDQDSAEKFLSKLAKDSFTGSQKDEFNALGTALEQSNSILNDFDNFKSINAGPYKTALEKAKPFANLKKDKKYTDLMQKAELAQAQIRKSLFGASLTGGEQSSAAKFAITENDDIVTIEQKLRNLKNLANTVRSRYINEARGLSNLDEEVGQTSGGGATGILSKYNLAQ